MADVSELRSALPGGNTNQDSLGLSGDLAAGVSASRQAGGGGADAGRAPHPTDSTRAADGTFRTPLVDSEFQTAVIDASKQATSPQPILGSTNKG